MIRLVLLGALSLAVAYAETDLEQARNKQDRAALDKIAGERADLARKSPNDFKAQYQFAQAASYASEVALEQRDKRAAAKAAEEGIKAAELAVKLNSKDAETHRLLGTLCGQIIPADVLSALRYGKCARDSINKAVELDPKSSRAVLSRGVGNYYLPPAFGGSVETAIQDFQKAIQLDPKSAEAHLWLGIALRKLNRNAEARKAIMKSLELNPNRMWAKQQLEKTPAK